MKPAIGLIELSSIARGLRTVDDMIKKAPINVLMSKTVSPGKFIILVTGDVASVDESMREGNQTADSYLVDHLFIPQIHPQVLPGIQSRFSK